MILCGYVLGLPIVHGVGHLCLGMERVEEEGAKWKLGSGLSFWVDPWVSQSELIEFFPQPDRKRMIRKEGKMKVSEVVHIDREGTIAELLSSPLQLPELTPFRKGRCGSLIRVLKSSFDLTSRRKRNRRGDLYPVSKVGC